MAWLRRHATCNWQGCTRVSTETLLTFRNDKFGDYCDRHANKALAERQMEEDRYLRSTWCRSQSA